MSKTGNRREEARTCTRLGTMLYSLSEFAKSRRYLEKALAIAIEIGDGKREKACYQNLGAVFLSLGDYVKAKEYTEKVLMITIEIGDRK